jgi:uncharacterized membrane protein YuzA (DUF378 family)
MFASLFNCLQGETAMKLDFVGWIALILIIIGGINWGLVGLFNFNLVTYLFSATSPIFEKIAYIIVGLAAVYLIFQAFRSKERKER